ncbi:MAG TPA: hypothetical protein VGN10_00700 [Pyrinomonadaceae bacterium]|jgi:hypothetical protein
MPKLLEGHTRPVTQNIVASGLWEFLYKGVPSLVTLFGGYKAISQGWTAPWVVGLGALVFLSLSAGLHLLAALFRQPGAVEQAGNVLVKQSDSDNGKKRVSTVPLARQPETRLEDCERNLRNAQSTVARLQRNDETHGIQISARDTQIEQLQAELTELKTSRYELVHRIADHQAKSIRDFVSVSQVATWEDKLNDPVPTIKWGFVINNSSVLTICLVEVRNNLFFENIELAERRFEDHNEVEQLGYGREGSFIFAQRLSGPEAQYIRNTPDGKFRFNRLKIKLGNPNSFPVIEPQEIDIGDDLETTLNGRAYKETKGMVGLRQERDRLKGELEKVKETNIKLTFEVDDKQSQVSATGGGTAGRRIAVKVRLRCMKTADHPMAVREFHAELVRENGAEQIIVPQETSLVVLDHPDMKIVDFSNGWTIAEPLTDYRWFLFYLDVTEQQLGALSHDYFIRIVMLAVGQKPYSVEFYIDNWEHARGSNSYITIRGKG